jgi:hypothetical protein
MERQNGWWIQRSTTSMLAGTWECKVIYFCRIRFCWNCSRSRSFRGSKLTSDVSGIFVVLLIKVVLIDTSLAKMHSSSFLWLCLPRHCLVGVFVQGYHVSFSPSLRAGQADLFRSVTLLDIQVCRNATLICLAKSTSAVGIVLIKKIPQEATGIGG